MLNKSQIETEVYSDFKELVENVYNIGIEVNQVLNPKHRCTRRKYRLHMKMLTTQKNEQTRKLDEGEKYKNEVVPASEAKAYKMIQDAEAYKAEVIAKANGEVAVFNAVYDKYKLSPENNKKALVHRNNRKKSWQNADKKIYRKRRFRCTGIPSAGNHTGRWLTVSNDNNTININARMKAQQAGKAVRSLTVLAIIIVVFYNTVFSRYIYSKTNISRQLSHVLVR